jgi:uncharacterized protein
MKEAFMHIDWNHFTPWSALLGGAVIGLAAAIFLWFNGRIAGISGVLGGLVGGVVGGGFDRKNGDTAWRLAFVAGLVLAPAIYLLVGDKPELQIDADYVSLTVAGLMVGVGTRYGAGCTSGHGVCGLSRFSLRSLVATCAFMLTGFVMVFVLRHLLSF